MTCNQQLRGSSPVERDSAIKDASLGIETLVEASLRSESGISECVFKEPALLRKRQLPRERFLRTFNISYCLNKRVRFLIGSDAYAFPF
jgi:hypothetical protein